MFAGLLIAVVAMLTATICLSIVLIREPFIKNAKLQKVLGITLISVSGFAIFQLARFAIYMLR